LQGLVTVVPEEQLTVIVNTGDDIQLLGLHISPDIDIVMYTLAGMVDEERGWGIRGDTFHCLDMLHKYGCETWFRLGDKDLATHIKRTCLLKSGLGLSDVTNIIRQALGLNIRILPMTEDKFETVIITDHGRMHFQEYLVKRGARDRVVGVEYEGATSALPSFGVADSIQSSDAIIICPSNPIVSIGTILSLSGLREALIRTKARVVAISPIVGGAPVKGPADKLMQGLGLEVSAFGVAALYKDFLDIFVIDLADESQKKRIQALGLDVVVTNTIMKSLRDKVQLANAVLNSIKLKNRPSSG